MKINNLLIEKQKLLVQLSSKYLDFEPSDFSYQTLCDDLLELSGAASVSLNLLIPNKMATKTVAMAGVSQNIRKASAIFGFKLVGKVWELDDFARAALRSHKVVLQGDVGEVTTYVSKKLGNLLKATFGIGSIYSIGLFRKDITLGTLVLIMKKDNEIEHAEIIELFAQQVGALLFRMDNEKILAETREKLEAVSIHSPDLLTLIDRNQKILYINKALPGFKMEEVLGDDVLNYIPASLREQYRLFLNNAFTKHEPFEEEMIAYGAEREITYYMVRFIPIIRDEKVTSIYIVSTDISARKKIEVQQSDERKRYEYIINGTGAGTWEWNIQTGEIILNKRWFEITGYTHEELKPTTTKIWKSLIHPDDLKKVKIAFDTQINGELSGYDVEYRMKHKSGHWVWVVSRGKVAVWDDEEGPLWMYGTIQDISNQKESEENLRILFDNSLGLLCTHDKNGKFLSINVSAASSLGYEIHELIDTNMSDLITHPRIRHLFDKYLREVFLKKRHEGIMSIKHKDDSLHYWDYHNTVTQLSNGEEIVIGTAIDITEKFKTEKALKESEQRFHQIADSINDVFYLYNIQDKKYEFISPNCKAILGADQEYFCLGQKYNETFVHPDDKSLLIKANESIQKGNSYEIEFRIIIDNEVRWLSEKSFPIKDEKGNVIKNSGIVIDITQHKNAEADIVLKHKILDAINTVQGSFITETNPKAVFEKALSMMLELTQSEYGFIGEVMYRPDDQPYLITNAITNISWNDETRKFYEENAPGGLEFSNLKTLFGAVLLDKKPLIANNPSIHLKSGGIPKGHPSLNAFLGLPIFAGDTMVGMAGVANRPGGYNEELINAIQPFTSTIGRLIDAQNSKYALQESENRLALVNEGAGDGIWDWDMSSGKMTFSKLYEEMLGYDEHELAPVADTLVKSVHPDDLPRVQQILEDYLEGRRPDYQVEMRLQCKDGNYKWIHCRGKVFSRNQEGKAVRIVGIHADITTRKKNEEKIRGLSDLIKDSLNEVYVFNIETLRFSFVNDTALKNLGYSTDEIYGLTPVDIKPEFTHELFLQRVSPLLSGKTELLKFETIYQRKNGSTYPVEINLQLSEFEGKKSFSAIVLDISERKKSEQIIKDKNRELGEITEAVDRSSLVSMTDIDGNITKVNNLFCEISQYSEEELIGKNHRILNSSYHPKSFWKEMWKTITDGKVWKGEVKNQAKDGSYFWASSAINPIFNSQGNVTSYLCIRKDITSRKLAEFKLEEARQKLNSIFNEMEDVVWSVRLPDYKMLFITPSVEKMFGIAYDDFMRDSAYWEKAIHPDDMNVVPEIYKLLSEKGHYEKEYRIIATDGKVKWINNKGKIILDDSGQPFRLDGYIRDITESKITEQHVLESEANLKEAHIIAKLGRWELDIVNNDLDWSDSIFKIFEIDQEKFGATYESFLNTIHPDDRDRVKTAYTDSMANKTPYVIEHRLLITGGRIKWLRESCRTDYDADGNALRSVGVVQDITESKNAEIELFRTKEFLTQTNKIARVGGWEANLKQNTLYWTDVTKEIHEVDLDFVPSSQSAINFYKEGENRKIITSVIEQTLTKGDSFDVELQIITAKGREIWVRAIGQAEIVRGECLRIYGTFQDIDESKKNQALIIQQNKFRKLIADVSSEFVKADVNTMDDIINNILKKCGEFYDIDATVLTQISQKDFTVTNIHKWIRQGSLAMQYPMSKRTLAEFPWLGQKLITNDLFIIPDIDILPEEADIEKKEWKMQCVKSLLFIRFDINNQPAGLFSFLSEKKVMGWSDEQIAGLKVIANIISDALSKNLFEKTAIEAKQKLNDIINEMDDVVWSVSLPDFKVLFTTPSVEKIFGISYDDFISDSAYWEKTVHPDDMSVVPEIYKLIEEKGHYEKEYRIIATDGEVKWISSKGKVILNDSGKPFRLDGYIREISESKLAEQRLRESEKMELEQKISEYKMMALRSAMNPHFIFNSLNSIQYYIVRNNKKVAVHYLHLFSKLVRDVLDSSTKSMIPLGKEVDILKHYTSLEQMRFNDKFEVEFAIDKDIDMEDTEIPPMLLQPYVENAILHGLSNKNKKGMLNIDIQIEGENLKCIIKDNGIGRKYNKIMKTKNPLAISHKPIGMSVTSDRLNIINKQGIGVKVIDLEDERGLPSGTQVELLIKITE